MDLEICMTLFIPSSDKSEMTALSSIRVPKDERSGPPFFQLEDRWRTREGPQDQHRILAKLKKMSHNISFFSGCCCLIFGHHLHWNILKRESSTFTLMKYVYKDRLRKKQTKNKMRIWNNMRKKVRMMIFIYYSDTYLSLRDTIASNNQWK